MFTSLGFHPLKKQGDLPNLLTYVEIRQQRMSFPVNAPLSLTCEIQVVTTFFSMQKRLG